MFVDKGGSKYCIADSLLKSPEMLYIEIFSPVMRCSCMGHGQNLSENRITREHISINIYPMLETLIENQRNNTFGPPVNFNIDHVMRRSEIVCIN